jgi:uncharacterized protein GlcG (DUF336 family)
MKKVLSIAVVVLVCAISSVSMAAITATKMTLDTATQMIKAAEEKAKAIGVPMVITVLDDGGNMVAQHRMDDALLVSVEVSLKKAYSAVSVKLPTDKIGELSQPGKMLYGLQNVSGMVIFGGGFPITAGDRIIGGIGVSGGSVEEDMLCAKAGLAAFGEN